MTNAPSLGHWFKHSAKREELAWSVLVLFILSHPRPGGVGMGGWSLPVAALYAGAIQGSELLVASAIDQRLEAPLKSPSLCSN